MSTPHSQDGHCHHRKEWLRSCSQKLPLSMQGLFLSIIRGHIVPYECQWGRWVSFVWKPQHTEAKTFGTSIDHRRMAQDHKYVIFLIKSVGPLLLFRLKYLNNYIHVEASHRIIKPIILNVRRAPCPHRTWMKNFLSQRSKRKQLKVGLDWQLDRSFLSDRVQD